MEAELELAKSEEINAVNQYKLKFFQFVSTVLINPNSIFNVIINVISGLGVLAIMIITSVSFWDCRYIPLYAFMIYWV